MEYAQVVGLESSESSNRLEGITAPRPRLEAIIFNDSSPSNRSEQEIAGYRDALALIHESAEDMNFSVNVILQLHSMINRYLPSEGGRWKAVDNQIVERNPDGSVRRVRFEPVSALSTPQAMDDLVNRYRHAVDIDTVEPLVVVPAAVFDFLCIHPFRDGNGRSARHLRGSVSLRVGLQLSEGCCVRPVAIDRPEVAGGRMMIVLQPRRVAARAVARGIDSPKDCSIADALVPGSHDHRGGTAPKCAPMRRLIRHAQNPHVFLMTISSPRYILKHKVSHDEGGSA